MRPIQFLFLPLLALILFSCSEDDLEQVIAGDGPGTKAIIQRWASVASIDSLESLGFTIYEGNTPPTVNGSYSLKDRALIGSNIPNDVPLGYLFFELRFTLSQQDNANQIINFNATEYREDGSATETVISVNDHEVESYIIGSGNNFSAFFKVDETKEGETATLIYAITGQKTSNGLANFKQGLIMLDEKDTPSYLFIRNNQGRVFKDQDGLASEL